MAPTPFKKNSVLAVVHPPSSVHDNLTTKLVMLLKIEGSIRSLPDVAREQIGADVTKNVKKKTFCYLTGSEWTVATID